MSAALVESVEVTKQVEHKVIKNSDSTFAQGHRFDPTFEFNVKGRGSADVALLGTADASYTPDQVSGGVTIITNVKVSETNEDFDSFEVSGVNYPAAS